MEKRTHKSLRGLLSNQLKSKKMTFTCHVSGNQKPPMISIPNVSATLINWCHESVLVCWTWIPLDVVIDQVNCVASLDVANGWDSCSCSVGEESLQEARTTYRQSPSSATEYADRTGSVRISGVLSSTTEPELRLGWHWFPYRVA